jgi:hypothetical protein
MIRSFSILILLLSLGQATDLLSQQLSHQVLVPVAGVVSTGNISYSHTIGETAIEIFNTPDFVLTQGFQQPMIRFSPEPPLPGDGVVVYPNPAIDEITVRMVGERARDFKIELINISGTVLVSEKISFPGHYNYLKVIPVGSFYKGMYLIRILSSDSKINQIFKIEKL